MNTLWHALWASLWQSKARSLLAILNIAVGIIALGSLLGMMDLQLTAMDAAHRQSQPSHVNLILRQPLSMALVERIRALPSVAEVETLTPLSMRFKQAGDSDWRSASLLIRGDYSHQSLDKSLLQAGEWPSAGQLAVEHLTAQFAGIGIGDTLELATPQGSVSMPIRGEVRHGFVKPPAFGGPLSFFADSSTARALGEPEGSARQLLITMQPPYSPQAARRLATTVRSLLGQHGIAVAVTLLQDPDKHWGRPFLAGINTVLQLMALAALLLASSQIFNTITAQIAQQTHSIGVMKALGGSTFTIAGFYLSETLLIAVMALLLAVPSSALLAYGSACHLLAWFNVPCGGFQFSMLAVSAMVVGGLLAPLLAAWLPVVRGARMSVRQALASYGLGGDFGSSRFDRCLERLAGHYLPTLYAAALGNVFRRKGRLLLTQLVLIIAGVLFMVLMSLMASVNLTLDNELARTRYAVRLGFSRDQDPLRIAAVALSIAPTQQLESWQRLSVELLHQQQPLQQIGSLGLQLIALPAASRRYQPLITAGRWLQADDAGMPHLVLSADTAAASGVAVGDSLTVQHGNQSQTWQVIGLYRWLAGNQLAVEPVYAPLESMAALTLKPAVASLAVLDAPMDDSMMEADYLARLKQGFEVAGIGLDSYTTQATLAQRQFARTQFMPIIGSLLGLASMIAVVGGLSLSATLAMAVVQRTREMGVLRAIGASTAAVVRLFLLEGVMHGLLAWCISVPVAYAVAPAMAQQLGQTMLAIALDYRFDSASVLLWLLVLLLLALLAAYWPARQAARLTVVRCLAQT